MNLDLDSLARLPVPDSPATEWQRAEGLEIERVRTLDRLVGDLTEFLGCARADVFGAAQAHAAGTRDDGVARLCHQALDLLAERERFHVLVDIFLQLRVGGLLDYGHGSAALSLPFARRVPAAMVVDQPGEALAFAHWRMARHGLEQAMALDIEQADGLPADTFPLIVCHLPQPDPGSVLARLTRWLAPGGVLFLGACWTPWRDALRAAGHRLMHEGEATTVAIGPA